MRKPISTGVVASMIKALAPKADPAVISQAVDDYLDAHPEISVADGSITEEKLAQDVLNQLGEIDTVKNALSALGLSVVNGEICVTVEDEEQEEGE